MMSHRDLVFSVNTRLRECRIWSTTRVDTTNEYPVIGGHYGKQISAGVHTFVCGRKERPYEIGGKFGSCCED